MNEEDIIRRPLRDLTDEEVGDILSGIKTHPILHSTMADAAGGYLLYRCFKPALKIMIPAFVACCLGLTGLVYGHKWFVENTETGRRLGEVEQKIIESDSYRGWAKACEAMQAMR